MITIRNKVAMVVYIQEGSSGTPVDSAEVVISSKAQPFTAQALSKPGGIYYFMDLAEGKYTVSASLPGQGSRYGSVEKSVTVGKDCRFRGGKHRHKGCFLLLGKNRRKGKSRKAKKASEPTSGDIKLVSITMNLNSTTVTGKVRGLGGGSRARGIVLAEVRIKGGQALAYTNSQGTYTLSDVEIGTRTLLFEAVGYESEEREITLTKAGETLTQNVVLR